MKPLSGFRRILTPISPRVRFATLGFDMQPLAGLMNGAVLRQGSLADPAVKTVNCEAPATLSSVTRSGEVVPDFTTAAGAAATFPSLNWPVNASSAPPPIPSSSWSIAAPVDRPQKQHKLTDSEILAQAKRAAPPLGLTSSTRP